ncbi:DNA methyltransferase [Aliivibrio sifiae]|uniref:DNA methyltransferase n=1 Tax=Aliivibrio sifiae TaxID=566293 RepID=UPI003D0FD3D5
MFKNCPIETSLSNSDVNIDNKIRSNLFSWQGQFSPQLIETLLINYGSINNVVFDPFLGSGTVLFESALLGLSASGCEINPAAVSFSKVYELVNQPKVDVLKSLTLIESILYPFLIEEQHIEELQKVLLQEVKTINKSSHIILMALIIGLDFGEKLINAKRCAVVWETLKQNINKLPHSGKKLRCYHSDSRKSPLLNDSVDLVITSPPYINVFNYHQKYRKSVESTGINVLKVAKSEIGSNRKFRPNRFLTVVQYSMDMFQVFEELTRVCKADAKLIFIVGRESNVKKTAFKNADLISQIANVSGFCLMGKQERVFKNKFGELIYEEILRFTPKKEKHTNSVESAREIGRSALKRALLYCDESVAPELREALEKSKEISTSPFLEA